MDSTDESEAPKIPEPVDLRFSIYESVYMKAGTKYNICGYTFDCRDTGMYSIIFAGKALGSGVIAGETVHIGPEEVEVQ